MEACHAEIMLIRPPAPGRERALAGPRARAALQCEARPGWQPALTEAAYGRACGDQEIIMHF